MSPVKLPSSLHDKYAGQNTGLNGNRPIKGIRWHQFHLWVGTKDFKFLEQLASEQEESIAHIIRGLIRQLRVEAERSRRVS